MPSFQQLCEEYHREAMPIIREMVLLELLAEPYIILKDGQVVEQGRKWVNPQAKEMYEKCEQHLHTLREMIFKDRTLSELTGGTYANCSQTRPPEQTP